MKAAVPAKAGSGWKRSAGRPDEPTTSVTVPPRRRCRELADAQQVALGIEVVGQDLDDDRCAGSSVDGVIDPRVGAPFTASGGTSRTVTVADASVPLPSTIV